MKHIQHAHAEAAKKKKKKSKGKQKGKAKPKINVVKHTSDYTSAMETSQDTVTDPTETVSVTDTRSSTTVGYTSGQVSLGVTTADTTRFDNKIEHHTVSNGHSTTTTTESPVWVGAGKSKHQEQTKNKNKWNLKHKTLKNVKHKVPIKTRTTLNKNIVPGSESTIERVFFNLIENMPPAAFSNWCGMSVDKAVLQPNKTFSLHHNAGMKKQTTDPNAVYYCSFMQGSHSGSQQGVVRFVVPAGGLGDDSYAFMNISTANIAQRGMSDVDSWAFKNGFKKILALNLWPHDYYSGIFIINDEKFGLGEGMTVDWGMTGEVLYLRRQINPSGTNAKLPLYSDCMWFATDNTTQYNTPAMRCGWNNGNYIWFRKSTMVGTTLTTTTTAYPMPNGGGY